MEEFEFKVDDLAKYWGNDRAQMWANLMAGGHCSKDLATAQELAKYDVLKAVFTKEGLQLYHGDKIVLDEAPCFRLYANLRPVLKMLTCICKP